MFIRCYNTNFCFFVIYMFYAFVCKKMLFEWWCSVFKLYLCITCVMYLTIILQCSSLPISDNFNMFVHLFVIFYKYMKKQLLRKKCKIENRKSVTKNVHMTKTKRNVTKTYTTFDTKLQKNVNRKSQKCYQNMCTWRKQNKISRHVTKTYTTFNTKFQKSVKSKIAEVLPKHVHTTKTKRNVMKIKHFLLFT